MSKWTNAVSKAIHLNKRTCVYTQRNNTAYNPSTGTSTITEVNTTFDAARDSSKKIQTQGTNLILVDKTAFYIPSTVSFVPRANDFITDGSDKYTIDKVEKHYGGGDLVLYIAWCNS